MHDCRPGLARAVKGVAAVMLLGSLTVAQEGAPAPSDPPTDPRSNEAHYVIQARVDDASPSDLDDGPHKRLTGSLTLTWRNRSGEAASDLWFHLYLNAFANNRSLHLTEGKGRLRRGHKLERGFGWQEVTSIRIGGQELVDSLTWRYPQPGAPLDRTVFSVDLPTPVADGGEVEVEIEWESRLPRVRRRWGTKGDFIFLAHWFPKLGVFEGGRGWRTHAFHLNTEFYSNFGTYDVTLDLPEAYAGKVGGSGVLAGEPQVTAGRVSTRFLAPSPADRERTDPVAARGSGRAPAVHGFAWTADPDYVEYAKLFRWDEWASQHEVDVSETMRALGRTRDELRTRDVMVRVLLQPEREAQGERHWRATCAALFFYGLWYGEYPYEQVTVVDPAWGGGAAGGMEYPTLFTCGTALFTRPSMYRPESVTVHEAGHQFWYGLVGNNEPEAAWLDEGLNSYSDSETLIREYGPRRDSTSYSGLPTWGHRPVPAPGGSKLGRALSMQSIDVPNPLPWALDRLDKDHPDLPSWLGWSLDRTWHMEPLNAPSFVRWWRDQPLLTFVDETTDIRWGDRSGYLRSPDVDAIETVVWDHADNNSYRTNSYPRTAVALRSIAGVVGRETFLKGMRGFAEEWRYRHPYPADFYRTFQERAEVDLQWYFDDVFRGNGTVDWSVQVDQNQDPESMGWFRCDDGTWQQSCAPDGSPFDALAAADVPADGAPEADADGDPEPGDEDSESLQLYDVVVKRGGSLMLPVTIRAVFEDGSSVDFEWTREQQAEKRWLRLPLAPGRQALSAVVIDPERLWYLDTDMSDNQWFAQPDRIAPSRWSERALAGAAHTLNWFMSIGG